MTELNCTRILAAALLVKMRADDHQLIQPLFISSVAKVDGKEVKFDADHSGMG